MRTFGYILLTLLAALFIIGAAVDILGGTFIEEHGRVTHLEYRASYYKTDRDGKSSYVPPAYHVFVMLETERLEFTVSKHVWIGLEEGRPITLRVLRGKFTGKVWHVKVVE